MSAAPRHGEKSSSRPPLEGFLQLRAGLVEASPHGAHGDVERPRDLDSAHAVPFDHDEDQAAIGYHVNVVPLRLKVDLEQGFGKLVRSARGVFLNSLGYADVPVDSLLFEVDRENSGWRNTLFQHVFNYVPGMDSSTFDFFGHTARFLSVENGFSKFDLEFFLLPAEDGIRIRVAYHTGAFDRDEVEQLASTAGPALTYHAGTDQYSLNWKTERVWRGTCRELVLRFLDGTTSSALFRFSP